jgi:hypothetical protein
MNRRNMLAAAAPVVLALAGAAAAAPAALNPDAELMALCASFHRLQSEGTDETNPDWEKATADAWDIFHEIDDLAPQTVAGHQAKATVAVRMLAMFHEMESGGQPEAVFALNMLRDWLGSAAA